MTNERCVYEDLSKPMVKQETKRKIEDLMDLFEISSKDKQEVNQQSSCQIYKSFNSTMFCSPHINVLHDAANIQSEFTSIKYIDELDVAHRGLFGALNNPPKSLNFLGITNNSKFSLALETLDEDNIKLCESFKEETVTDKHTPEKTTETDQNQDLEDPWENLENLMNNSKALKKSTRSPYLCHAPLERMEELYYRYEDSLRLIDSERFKDVYNTSEPFFRACVKYVLRGIVSRVFLYNDHEFTVNGSPMILGLTPDCLASVLPQLLECGRLVKRLSSVSWQPAHGFVRNTLAAEVQNMLQTHDELVEMIMDPQSLIAIVQGTRTILPSLRLLNDLWYWPGWERPTGSGVGFLQHLVNLASASTDSIEQDLYSGYFISCCRPFLTFLSNWIYRGQCWDPYKEFLISINSEYREKRDRSYWTDGFSLDVIQRDKGPFVGSILDDDAIYGLYTDIYLCGKTVNLLELCHGKNNFDQGPSLRIGVSLSELKSIRSECLQYAEKMPPEVQFIDPPKKLGKLAQAAREEKLAQLVAEKQARDRQKLADKVARNIAARAELDEQLELKRAEQKRLDEEERMLDEDIKLYHELVDRRDAKEKQRLLMKYAQLLSDQPIEDFKFEDELNANESGRTENIETDNQNNILARVQTNISEPLSVQYTEMLANNNLVANNEISVAQKDRLTTSKGGVTETKNKRRPSRKEPTFLTKEAIKAKVLYEEFGIDPRCAVQPVEIVVGKAVPAYKPSGYTPKAWNIPPTESYTKEFTFEPQEAEEELEENDWSQLCRPESNQIFNLSLSFFVQRSLLLPVRTQCQMVNRSLMASLIGNEYRLMKHLDTLRQFLFLDNGPFSYSLARSIGQRLGQLTHAHQLVNVPSMSFILQTALNAVHADEHYASRLSFYIKETPSPIFKSHFDILDCFTLRYRVEWPLNLVFTEEIMDSYSQIFSFILQVRLAAWSMQDVFAELMKSDACLGIHGTRHTIEFFVNTLQNYVMSQLLSLAWNDFVSELKKSARSLDDLYNIHANYVHRAKARLLLSTKSASLMKIIRDALGLSLKFRSTLLAANFQNSPQLQAQVNSIHNKAKEYAKFIRLILEKASDRTQQPHLLELLLKLNYNQFYN